jgi:dTDP-glucose 4,6-dehydratase
VPGERYNIGGANERTNLEVVDAICAVLDRIAPRAEGRYAELKTFVADRPGHDLRYAIDATRIREELGWRPSFEFTRGLEQTVTWYRDRRDWCEAVTAGRYDGERLGLTPAAGTSVRGA